ASSAVGAGGWAATAAPLPIAQAKASAVQIGCFIVLSLDRYPLPLSGYRQPPRRGIWGKPECRLRRVTVRGACVSSAAAAKDVEFDALGSEARGSTPRGRFGNSKFARASEGASSRPG